MRKLAGNAFAPRVVKALEPDIIALVTTLLDDVEERGSFDVIADLAYPLPVAVICRLLGVPISDEPEFSRASALLGQSLDPLISFAGDLPDNFDERMRAGMWLREYLADLIGQRRGGPGDDLMSGLIAVEESGDQLTEDEIIATCNLPLIEETLRYDPPVQLMGRIAGEQMTIGDALAAAQHDPT